MPLPGALFGALHTALQPIPEAAEPTLAAPQPTVFTQQQPRQDSQSAMAPISASEKPASSHDESSVDEPLTVEDMVLKPLPASHNYSSDDADSLSSELGFYSVSPVSSERPSSAMDASARPSRHASPMSDASSVIPGLEPPMPLPVVKIIGRVASARPEGTKWLVQIPKKGDDGLWDFARIQVGPFEADVLERHGITKEHTPEKPFPLVKFVRRSGGTEDPKYVLSVPQRKEDGKYGRAEIEVGPFDEPLMKKYGIRYEELERFEHTIFQQEWNEYVQDPVKAMKRKRPEGWQPPPREQPKRKRKRAARYR